VRDHGPEGSNAYLPGLSLAPAPALVSAVPSIFRVGVGGYAGLKAGVDPVIFSWRPFHLRAAPPPNQNQETIMPASKPYAYVPTANDSLTTPPGSPKILIHTRQGRCVGIYCDQPAKILEVETQGSPRYATEPRHLMFRALICPQTSVKVVGGCGTSVAHMLAMAFDDPSMDGDVRKTLAAHEIEIGERVGRRRVRRVGAHSRSNPTVKPTRCLPTRVMVKWNHQQGSCAVSDFLRPQSLYGDFSSGRDCLNRSLSLDDQVAAGGNRWTGQAIRVGSRQATILGRIRTIYRPNAGD
jgi:hypothetical protein